ncbi:IS982 family transposase [Psychrobacter phenylpyruvicus]|uniref:Transposase DDE domain n=1 Tax=Psychrobacter phenylpyruvicus TaxID=29432 RepID=A0A379LIL9_9GAMM|nr:IS982 family transposase [Psychrobacter phenylpyruvicus]SUD90291.1 Transposase DDE domain [Psychrobacter phenylpyruvicus]
MPLDEFIINIYLMVEQYYNLVVQKPLRRGGYAPKLSDTEIICMELVGEFLGMDQDKQIWQYFKHHWLSWFPTLGSYPNFAKQCANLWMVKQHIQEKVSLTQIDDIHFIDGFPIPVCKYARAYRHKTFKADASFSYCASKQEKYYGFAGHLLINMSGMIKGFTFASACIDERDVAPEITHNVQGLLGADKGYIRPKLKQYFASIGIDFQTPFRSNMKDDRPKSAVNRLMRCRRNIETVISQLTENFNIQKVRARDWWHLSHRLTRKILAHNFCFLINKQLGNPPLQFDLLLKC